MSYLATIPARRALSSRAHGARSLAAKRLALAQEHVDLVAELERLDVPQTAIDVLAGRFDKRRPAVEACERWAKMPKGLFVITGPIGGGKTTATAIFVARTRALFRSHADLARPWEWQPVFDECLTARHLVIDEIAGHGATDDKAWQRLGELIKARWHKRRVTLLTANMPEAAFARAIDAAHPGDSRILDVLRDGGEWLEIDEPSGRDGTPPDTALLDGSRRLLAYARVVKVAANPRTWLCDGAPHIDPDPDPLGDGHCRALHEPLVVEAITALEAAARVSPEQSIAEGKRLDDEDNRVADLAAQAAARFKFGRFGEP